MKEFFIALTLFLWVNQASAAQLAPGSLPSTTPLQPLPENVLPNYRGSVNYTGIPGPESGEGDARAAPGQAPAGGAGDNGQSGGGSSGGAESRFAPKAVWVALLAILGVILAYGFWRKKLAKKT